MDRDSCDRQLAAYHVSLSSGRARQALFARVPSQVLIIFASDRKCSQAERSHIYRLSCMACAGSGIRWASRLHGGMRVADAGGHCACTWVLANHTYSGALQRGLCHGCLGQGRALLQPPGVYNDIRLDVGRPWATFHAREQPCVGC